MRSWRVVVAGPFCSVSTLTRVVCTKLPWLPTIHSTPGFILGAFVSVMHSARLGLGPHYSLTDRSTGLHVGKVWM